MKPEPATALLPLFPCQVEDFALLRLHVSNAYTLKGGLRHVGAQLTASLDTDWLDHKVVP